MDTRAPAVANGAGQQRGRERAGRAPRDIALSMGALLVPVILLVLAYNVLFNGDHPRAIDPSGSILAARQSASFPVVEPQGLPRGWTVISSSYQRLSDGSVLRLGYLTPGRAGLQVIESDRPVNALLPDELGTDAQPGDLVPVGDQRWRGYPVARGGSQALVLATNGRTVIVIGSGSSGDLRVLAGSLR